MAELDNAPACKAGNGRFVGLWGFESPRRFWHDIMDTTPTPRPPTGACAQDDGRPRPGVEPCDPDASPEAARRRRRREALTELTRLSEEAPGGYR